MQSYSPGEIIFSYIVLTWVTIWKGISLWKAARNSQRNWFIILLVLPLIIPQLFFLSLGLMDIIYLFRFAKKRMTLKEIKDWFSDTFLTKNKS